MTSQTFSAIFKNRVLAICLVMMTTVSIFASAANHVVAHRTVADQTLHTTSGSRGYP